MKGMKFMNAVGLCLAAFSGTVFAQEAAFELPSASGAYIKDYEAFKLAANETDGMVKKSNKAVPEVQKSEFEPSWLTGSKVHQYLGLGTIVAAGLTAMAAPDSGCERNNCTATTTPRQTNGLHAHLAKATIAMAAATIASGLVVHWDDIHLADGFIDPDNLHVMLGVTGAALMAYAVNRSKNSAVPISHAGIAELGALGMVVAIKLTW
jgi:hypothetical protein